MDICTEWRPAISAITSGRSPDWVHHVIKLLDAALHQMHNKEKAASETILRAASLLRQQLNPPAARQSLAGGGYLLAWQARKVREYIASHIAEPVLVADLCALVARSEAHFSRSFKRTFGESPHSFILRSRVTLAAHYMLKTDASLSDIAISCGFSDQAHLSKQFRQAMRQTPAAWRRESRSRHTEHGARPT
jgi:AraC family transcriptional regulator